VPRAPIDIGKDKRFVGRDERDRLEKSATWADRCRRTVGATRRRSLKNGDGDPGDHCTAEVAVSGPVRFAGGCNVRATPVRVHR
jgi:hypothetical protein